MRNLLATLILAAVVPPASAQGIDALRAELSFSGLASEGAPLGGGSLRLDGHYGFGRTGLQLSAGFEGLEFSDRSLDDLEAAALRLILTRDVTPDLRLGVSAGVTGGDEPTAAHLSLGLHALWHPEGFRLSADLIKGLDDNGTNGAIIATIHAEQDLRPGVVLRGELFRRSTDDEGDDRAVALLGLRHDFSPQFYGFGDLFRSSADDLAFVNDGLRLGAGWRWSERGTVYAALTGKAGTGLDSLGLTIGLRLSMGDGLFDSGPLPEFVATGAY
jgi:hypothetical protein